MLAKRENGRQEIDERLGGRGFCEEGPDYGVKGLVGGEVVMGVEVGGACVP